ncbi:phage tail sheath family protein [Solibacillus sp. A46]|uniref:Phage tail sheath family protein n=1 Tax=Solibacillus faecavium TaxID=2762221 RepID=A0ABR8XZ32_9BACL|nr:phage tail sheath subtilisin-like domain-containing protein [Solibacillus faecavium]MBD8037089.1 phage tail sheath family protein [Solibacillus faecavium]
MALGGGFWLTQNKVLPGTYHNFISKQRAFVNLSDRGYAALPIVLDWGVDDAVMTVTKEDFQKDSLKLFGYDYTHEKLKGIRDLFKGALTVFFHKLSLGGSFAENDFAKAKYKGERGNAIRNVIRANVDEPSKFDVYTYLDNTLVDEQVSVADATVLKDNDYVDFKKNATLAVTAGAPLTGGANGATALTAGTPHQMALDELEGYGFNTIGCLSSDPLIKSLYVEYTKRIRDEVGAKFQLVGHKLGAVDHEGIIDIQNDTIGEGEEVFGATYWVTGVQAGVAVNQSNTNRTYDGEHTLDMSETKTQPQLTLLLNNGKYVFHRVGGNFNVLEDVNTFTSFRPDKNEDFSFNQTIRVLDQLAIDTAHLFNTRYLGKVPNDNDGRISLWKDIGAHRMEMQRIRAIQNYDKEKLLVGQGQSKRAVVVQEEVINTLTMSQLYVSTEVA